MSFWRRKGILLRNFKSESMEDSLKVVSPRKIAVHSLYNCRLTMRIVSLCLVAQEALHDPLCFFPERRCSWHDEASHGVDDVLGIRRTEDGGSIFHPLLKGDLRASSSWIYVSICLSRGKR
jgi:hypothetical protein